MGIDKNNFKATAQLVMAQMRKNRDWDRMTALEDMIPLFEPHKFWDSQPVPKITDTVALGDEMFDCAIETKTVDQVNADPYDLPAEYHWDNLDLMDDEVA